MKYQNANVEDLMPEIRTILKENQYQEEIKDQYSDEIRIKKHLKKGLFINGITGSGKTHTLYAIRSVVSNWGKATKVENWVKLLYEMKQDNFAKTDSIIKNIIESEYIFIDDLGAETAREWNEEMLYLIINEAYNNQRTVFITTNLDDEKLIQKYGDRILSRIGEMCVSITMPEKDLRIDK